MFSGADSLQVILNNLSMAEAAVPAEINEVETSHCPLWWQMCDLGVPGWWHLEWGPSDPHDGDHLMAVRQQWVFIAPIGSVGDEGFCCTIQFSASQPLEKMCRSSEYQRLQKIAITSMPQLFLILPQISTLYSLSSLKPLVGKT